MISGAQDICYNVADMCRAIGFYSNVVGLKLIHHGERWSAVDVGGVRLGLDRTGGDSIPESPGDAHRPYTGAQSTLRVDDIQATARYLELAGARVLSEVWDRSWGKLVVFRDPDGNYLTLMQPKPAGKQGRAA